VKPVQLRPLNMPTLRDQIEVQVRNAISNGAFKPGERIIETVIADQLNVSRAPVREALSVLEREGVVVSHPRRGYFVSEFSDKDIEEIYSFRALLEVEALRRAVDRLTPEDIEELQGIVDQLREAIRRRDDFNSIVALDFAFHETLCRVADQSRLYSAWNSMRWQTSTLIGVTFETYYNLHDQPEELHQQVLDAIKTNDLARAEAALKEHILDAERRARLALQELRAPVNP
jgi:DNA-binding GntR family transcriptional regulator